MKFITFFSSGVTGDVHSCQHKCSEGLYKMYILSVFNNNNCVLEFSTLVGKLLWFWTYNHKLSCGIDWMCLSRQASSLSSDRQELRTSRKCLVHLCGSIHPRYPCLRIPDRRKTVILGNFSNLGLPYPEGQPLYRQGPNLVCHTLCSVTSRILSRYSAAFGRQKTQILPVLEFGILWCHQLAAYGESWTRVHNCKPSRMQWYQNRFYTPTASWRNRTQNLRRSKTWRAHRQQEGQHPLTGQRAPPILGGT